MDITCPCVVALYSSKTTTATISSGLTISSLYTLPSKSSNHFTDVETKVYTKLTEAQDISILINEKWQDSNPGLPDSKACAGKHCATLCGDSVGSRHYETTFVSESSM